MGGVYLSKPLQSILRYYIGIYRTILMALNVDLDLVGNKRIQ